MYTCPSEELAFYPDEQGEQEGRPAQWREFRTFPAIEDSQLMDEVKTSNFKPSGNPGKSSGNPGIGNSRRRD